MRTLILDRVENAFFHYFFLTSRYFDCRFSSSIGNHFSSLLKYKDLLVTDSNWMVCRDSPLAMRDCWITVVSEFGGFCNLYL